MAAQWPKAYQAALNATPKVQSDWLFYEGLQRMAQEQAMEYGSRLERDTQLMKVIHQQLQRRCSPATAALRSDPGGFWGNDSAADRDLEVSDRGHAAEMSCMVEGFDRCVVSAAAKAKGGRLCDSVNVLVNGAAAVAARAPTATAVSTSGGGRF